MKTTETLNTDVRLYLVKYQHTLTRGKFITHNVADVLKNYPTDKGIEYIKTFDSGKEKFVRISRADILRFHSWDTDAFIMLQNHSFFK
jgi:hypothetical protein